MIDTLALIGIIIVGMWGAFYLGSRKDREKIFDIDRELTPENMDILGEVTDEEYDKYMTDNKALNSWKRNVEETDQ